MNNELLEKSIMRVQEAYRFSQSLNLGKLYVCFSGGKDSIALKHVCELAFGKEVHDKCEFVYNLTTVDPPELVQFIKSQHPDVVISKPETTMWKLIASETIPPTRIMRYCCAKLKERGGRGRFVVTGVRWAESNRRKATRGEWENMTASKKDRILNADNDEDRQLLEHCIPKEKYICNAIIDWTDDDIWQFIREREIPYCKLYDEGFKRVGCIGCPMQYYKRRQAQLDRYPTYKRAYIRAFDMMVENRKIKGLETKWKDGQEVYDWWVSN